jgi:hypothetical protein
LPLSFLFVIPKGNLLLNPDSAAFGLGRTTRREDLAEIEWQSGVVDTLKDRDVTRSAK